MDQSSQISIAAIQPESHNQDSNNHLMTKEIFSAIVQRRAFQEFLQSILTKTPTQQMLNTYKNWPQRVLFPHLITKQELTATTENTKLQVQKFLNIFIKLNFL